MTDPTPTHRELLERLHALVQEGQARFLRERRPPLDLAPRRTSSERPSLFARAQAELLATYRAEIARLLHAESLRLLFALPDADRKLHRSVTADRELTLVPREEIRRRARRSLELAPAEAAENGLGDALRDLLEDHEASAALAARFARASLELAPRAETRVTAAVALHLDGRTEEARELLERVLAACPRGLLRSLALEHLAWFDRDAGRAERALRGYRRSFETCRERPAPLIAWLAAALRLGDREEALEAVRALAEMPPPSEAALESCLRLLSAPIPRELPDTHLAREIAEEHGPLARRIVQAL